MGVWSLGAFDPEDSQIVPPRAPNVLKASYSTYTSSQSLLRIIIIGIELKSKAPITPHARGEGLQYSRKRGTREGTYNMGANLATEYIVCCNHCENMVR